MPFTKSKLKILLFGNGIGGLVLFYRLVGSGHV